MSQIVVSRYSGAENLFLLGLVQGKPSKNFSSQIPSLCKKHQVDGLLLLQKINLAGDEMYQWYFFNSDGSAAEMCGNAARCATLFLHQQHDVSVPMDFKTEAGIVTGDFKDSFYEVTLSVPEVKDPAKTLIGKKWRESFFSVNTGVPHLVYELKTDDLFQEKENYRAFAQEFRKHPDLGNAGSNVTLVAQDSHGKKAMTFERGVEDFTAACGTGAVAAALYFYQKDHLSPQKIDMPGGRLEIALDQKNPILRGPTKLLKKDIQIEVE